jgi:predicted dehydrogenase
VTRVAVVGFGSAGRRHLDALRELGVERAVVRRAHGEALDVPVFTSLDEAGEWGADAIVVATPTSEHVDALRWAVSSGRHALIEKPLAATSDGVAELLTEARAAGVCVAVGCNLRFHPAAEAIHEVVQDGALGKLLYARAEVGQHLPDWHPEEDHRESYAARLALGGGAAPTLVHELDLALWIAGDVLDAVGVRARVGDVTQDADDVAEIVCRHAGGALTSVHMDFLDRAYHRRSRWVCERGSLEWTWEGGVTKERGDGVETIWSAQGFDLAETYRRELEDFLDAMRTGAAPRCNDGDGLRALAVLDRIRFDG